MTTLIAIGLPMALLVALDVLAVKFGVDTRPGFDESRRLS